MRPFFHITAAKFFGLIAALALVFSAGLPVVAATTWTVTKTADTNDGVYNQGTLPVTNSTLTGDSTPYVPAQLPGNVEADWWTTVQEQIRRSEYDITWQESTYLPDLPAPSSGLRAGAYQASNRAQNLRTYFTAQGPIIIPRTGAASWQLALQLVAWGWAGVEQAPDRASLHPSGPRIEYRYPDPSGLIEWYVNGELGLEQGFTLAAPPGSETAGDRDAIVLELALDTDLAGRLAADGAVELVDPAGAVVLRYGSLYATDAAGRALPTHLELVSGQASAVSRQPSAIRLIVDAAAAVFPITLDPTITGLSPTANWTVESDQAYAGFGDGAGTAGDVNGDGYDDVIVGASAYDNGQSNEGRAFLYYGSASGLSTTPAWTAESNQASASFGAKGEVGSAGDVNGDGYADVIVGAQQYDNGQTDEGTAWVWYGSATGLGPSGTPANADWSAESNQAAAYFGISVGTAGDVNGDGYADVIVGAFGYDGDQSNEGRIFIYYGGVTGLSISAAWTAESDQTDPNWFTAFGYSAGTAGDVNGDGYADVIVGAVRYDRGQADEGAAFVWYGSASGLGPNGNPANADWIGESDRSGAELGAAVGAAGDVNGDGYADVFADAHWYNGWRGRIYVYHGSASGLSASASWSVEGDQGGAELGWTAGGAGDVNGDGYADLIVGAVHYTNGESNEGRAYVYQGSATGLGTSAAWTAEGNQVNAIFSVSLGTAGDVNGDGYADVIVGAPQVTNGQTYEGRAFVFHGAATGLAATAAWNVESDQANAWLGWSAGSAGDVNGDGYADVIVGAPYYDNGQADEGRTYVYHGSAAGLSTSAVWTAESDQASARFGWWVGTAGDVNGDGYADVIVGARTYDNGQIDEGRVFVYHGSAAGLSASAAWTAESDQADASLCASGTAGDVNGDGYADIIVGALYYDNGQTDEGRAWVYHGSASGLSSTATWTAEGDQSYAYFGALVGTAGDVNGDGYADVVVVAHYYDNGEQDEGRVFVYHGSATGLSTSAAWTAESNQVDAHVGAAGTAGDVNGDGYADVVVGASNYDNPEDLEGRAWVYHGSAAGLSTSPNWMAESNRTNTYFGGAAGTAGDVNGDGYADVIIAGPYYDNGQNNEGGAWVYYGSAAGLGATAGWTAEGDQASAEFGDASGTAGDVNGDGYADIIVGASHYDNGQTDEGRAYVYYGNASRGLALRPQQRRADDSVPVAPGGQVISPTAARLAALARTPFGRGDVALLWEVKPEGVAFNGSGLGQGPWTDSGTAGASLSQLISSLSFETRYRWRVRILGRPLKAASSSFVTYRSRWLYGSTFFTALSGEQAVGGAGQINLLSQAAYVNVGTQGALTNLTLRGYPQTAHPQASAYTGFGYGSQVLDRYFSVTPNGDAAGYSVGLCLNYDDAEVTGAGADESLLVLCRWAGTAWDCLPRAAGSDPNANLVCTEGVTGFSDWVVAQGPVNRPPVAVANGPYDVLAGRTVTLSGSGSYDPDAGDTLIYAWDLDGDMNYGETGPDAARGDEMGATPIFSAVGLMAPLALTVRLRVTDPGGLSNDDAATVTVADATPPVITPGVSGTLGSNDWYVGDVAVSWTVTDGESAMTATSGCEPTTLSADTAGVTLTCSATSAGGANSQSVTVKLDKNGPSANLAVTAGTLGLDGWYTSDLTISTSGSDDVSGPVTCAADQYQTTETASTDFNGSCTNDAGLTTAAAPLTIKLDKTGPSASLAVTAGTLGAQDWYTSDVTVSTAGSDDLSSPISCAAGQYQTTDTSGTEFNGSCTNAAGLNTAAAPLTIKLDKTGPSASLAVTAGTLGAQNWYTSDVTVSASGSDDVSSPVTCTVDQYQATDTPGAEFNGSCTNAAGLSTVAAPLPVKRDATPPAITWNDGPADGGAYVFGSIPAAPTCTATDLTSGPNGCLVTGYETAVGSYTLTATAYDVAGNSTIETRAYTVVAWTLRGFYSPVEMNGADNSAKGGSTVPLKFEVFAGSTELTDVAAVKSLTYAETDCGANTISAESAAGAAGGTGLRFDPKAGQFIYNWKTPKTPGACLRLTLTAQDLSTLVAYFKLK